MKDKGDEFDMDEKMKELAEKENISFLKTLLKFKNKDTSIKTTSPKEVSKYLTNKEKSNEPKYSDIKEENNSNVVIISDLNQINTEPISKEQIKAIKPNEEIKNIIDNSISSIQSLEQEIEHSTKKVVVDNKKVNTIDNTKNTSQNISKRSTFYNTAKSIREIEQLMRATNQIEKTIQMKSYSTKKHFNITYQKKANTPALAKTDYVTKSKYQSSFKELGRVQKELFNQKGKNKVKKIVIRNQKFPLNSYYQEAKKNQKILLTEHSKGNYKNKSTSLRGNTNNKTKSKSVPKLIKKVKESEKVNVKKYSIMKNKENQYCIVNKK